MIHDNSQQNELSSGDDSIRLGICDWKRQQWMGDFYPHDLPEDWQLGYYANEYSVVLVSAANWQTQLKEMPAWAEEVPENFRFYLQCEEGAAIDRQAIKAALGNALGGFVSLPVAPAEIINDVALINLASKDLRGWREWLDNNASQLSLIFIQDDALSAKQLSDFKALIEIMNL